MEQTSPKYMYWLTHELLNDMGGIPNLNVDLQVESTLRYLQQKHFKTMGLPGLCYLMTRKEINLVKSPFPYTLPRPDPITSVSTSCSDSIRVHPKRVHVSSNGFPEGTAFKKRSHDLGIQPRHDFQLPFFWGIFGHLAGERNSPGKRNIPLGEMP